VDRATPRAAGRAGQLIEQEFSIGKFDCKAEMPPGLQFPMSLDNIDVQVFPQLTLDLQIVKSALRRLVVHGSVAPRIQANPLITAALEAKAECLFTARVIILPIGGPISLIIGGQIPVGVGIEAGAKATFGQLGFDAFMQASLAAEFGIDCPADCHVVAEMSSTAPDGFFKPRLPTFEEDLRFEVSGSAFGFAKLTIGNPFLRDLRFEVVELKAGLAQKFELAGRTAQASDAAYASTFDLKPLLEFKTSSKLQAVANLLEVTLAELSFAPELPAISRSPRGSFVITPGAVVAGDQSGLGEPATFTVTLDPVDYLGAYAVESVDILHRTASGALEPGRPGCTRVEAASGQTVFSCRTDFLGTDVGPQTFHAFVNARIFGVPVPASLEVAPDGKATVEVTTRAPTAPTVDVRGLWRSNPNDFSYTDSTLQIAFPAQGNFTLSGAPSSASGTFTFDDGIHGGAISITLGGLDPACPGCGFLITDFQMTLSDGTSFLLDGRARHYCQPQVNECIVLSFRTVTDTHGHVWSFRQVGLMRPT
jgi:hypothetical protein